jgi:hypothetical protein
MSAEQELPIVDDPYRWLARISAKLDRRNFVIIEWRGRWARRG